MIYVLQVKPGTDMNVRAALERERIAAYAPRREMTVRRNGCWRREISLMLPGYVFADCDYSAEIFYRVKPIDGVLKWLGKPTPIINEEARFMRLLFNGGKPITESTADIDIDRNVKITGGWLLDKQNYIRGFNVRKRRALLEIHFGGKLHRMSAAVDFVSRADKRI